MRENVGGSPVRVVSRFSHEDVTLLEEDGESFGSGVEHRRHRECEES